VISHKHKFIYTRVAKSGSTSIIESFVPGYVKTKTGWFIPVEMTAPGHNQWSYDRQHIPLYHMKKHCEPVIYETYFKFAFARNPYDRLVSSYLYTKDWYNHYECMDKYSTFKQFVTDIFVEHKDETCRSKYGPQYEFVKGSDYVGRYEKLQQHYDHVCHILNVPQKNLPVENRVYPWRWSTVHNRYTKFHQENPLPPRAHYSAYYDTDTKRLIDNIFQQDIELYQYSYEQI